MPSKLTPKGGFLPLLDGLSRALSVPVAEPSAKALAAWLELLAAWNERIDLTAARTPEQLVELMVADALVLSCRLSPSVRVIDVGSGAGAPGIPLGLLRPDLALTCLEPMQKRVSFLRTVVGTVAARNITVQLGKVPDGRLVGFDVAISRATLAPPEWLEAAYPLVAEGGQVWVLLARESPPESPRFSLRDSIEYMLPLACAARRAVVYERQKA